MNSSPQRPALVTSLLNMAISRLSRLLKASPAAAQESGEPLSIDNPFPGRPRVLLADDDRANHSAINALLLPRGIKPVLAADGAEAVALACGHQFDLILMDIQMPILDGLAAAAQIRRHERAHGQPSAPIVAYTSGSIADDEDGLRAFGLDGALAKPCTAASLDGCLARWCGDVAHPVQAERRLAGSG